MEKITIQDLVSYKFRCINKNLFGLNNQITVQQVRLLKKADLLEYFTDKDYSRIFKMKFDTIEQFLIKFKKDCNLYMINEEETITVNNYMNFLEEIGYSFVQK